MTGRPTRLTSEIQKTICDNITAGLKPEDAAQYADVPRSTFYNWLRRGEAEGVRLASSIRAKPRVCEQPFLDFWNAIKKARLGFKRTHIMRVQVAGLEHWQASAWTLERCFPNEFGQKVLVQQRVAEELEAVLDRLEQQLDITAFAQVLRILAADSESATSATALVEQPARPA